VTPIELPFEEIWFHDFEFVARPGERPDVVCLVAIELRTGRTVQLWRDELTGLPPYRTDNKALFVSFVGNAEVGCHLALGWPAPAKVLDLNPVFRNLTNGLYTPEGKGLIGLLRYFGLDSIDAKRKDAMRKRVMQGPPFTAEERRQILAYCKSDVESLAQVLPKVLPAIDLGVALYHGEFAAVSALMAFNGVPIDREIFNQLADAAVWRAVRDEMVPGIDSEYGVYRRGPKGDWVFTAEAFKAYQLLQRTTTTFEP
jgi:DNA polymerase-1